MEEELEERDENSGVRGLSGQQRRTAEIFVGMYVGQEEVGKETTIKQINKMLMCVANFKLNSCSENTK